MDPENYRVTTRLQMARKQAADQMLRLDNQICFAIYSTAHAFNRGYKPLLDRLGLTYPQYLVMLVLWERDGVPVKDIGERLYLDSGTLTPLLKRLEASGLVKRTRSTEDERQVLIALTPQGQALREAARAVPQSILAASACSIGELSSMKNEIVALRDRLNAVLGEQGGGRARKHQRRFLAKARPDGDFKYFSNAKACAALLKAT